MGRGFSSTFLHPQRARLHELRAGLCVLVRRLPGSGRNRWLPRGTRSSGVPSCPNFIAEFFGLGKILSCIVISSGHFGPIPAILVVPILNVFRFLELRPRRLRQQEARVGVRGVERRRKSAVTRSKAAQEAHEDQRASAQERPDRVSRYRRSPSDPV